jgi:hypothetical protein
MSSKHVTELTGALWFTITTCFEDIQPPITQDLPGFGTALLRLKDWPANAKI